VNAIEAVCGSLPDSADQIRRRFWRDPEFRTVCEDYLAARETLARLESESPPDAARTAEYRQLGAELLDEAKAMLKTNRS
jgi:hypothetical protein